MSNWITVDVMSCHLKDQTSLYNSLGHGDDVADTQKFVAWGAPDIIAISRMPGEEGARNVYNRNTESGIFDRQVYFGHEVGGTSEKLKTLTARLPIVGVSFIRIKDYVIRKLPEEKLGLKAYEWIVNQLESSIIPQVHKAFPELPPGDLQYILCGATGWADTMLIVFCNSFAPIQLLLSHLRMTTTKDVLDYYKISCTGLTDIPNHILVTTCTIPGTHIGPLAPTTPEEAVSIASTLCDKLARWDNKIVRTIIKAHSKPGHLNEAMTVFGDSEDIFPTLGRSDFMVGPSVDDTASTSAHHKFMIEKLLPGAPESLMWTETHFGFMGPAFCVEKANGYKTITKEDLPQHSIESFSLKEAEQIFNYVPPHTARAFKQIGGNLLGLVQHEATRDYYESLFIGYETALRNAIDTAALMQAEDDERGLIRLAANIGRACEGLDLCYKDRYRGAFPAGSTSAVPALTSHASFHKSIAVVDGLANAALDIVHRDLRKRIPSKSIDAHRRKFAICCHLGNAPVPSIVVTYLLCVGFMNIPTDLMFEPGGIAYILHEAGHVFWSQLLLVSNPSVKHYFNAQKSKLTYLIEEIFCDMFTLSAVFRGDNSRMKEVSIRVLEKLALDDDDNEIAFRCLTAGIIFDYIMDKDISPLTIDKLGETGKDFFDVFTNLINIWPEYLEALKSICSLAKIKEMKDINASHKESLLAVQRHFAKETSPYSPENFTHILWQLLRR
jgi:hypothetical protein